MRRKGMTAWVVGFAVITAGLASAGLGSILNGTFGFTHILDWRAAELVAEPSSKSNMDAAEVLSRQALRQSPYDNYARLMRAYLETRTSGRLGPVGVSALEQSYALMPVDYSVAEWRIRFALQYWSEVTPATREAVRYEVLAFSKLPIQSVNVRNAITGVQDPAGALAAAMLRREIGR